MRKRESQRKTEVKQEVRRAMDTLTPQRRKKATVKKVKAEELK